MKNRLESLPDTLTTEKGEKIISSEQWLKRRRFEILDLFSEQIYGHSPVPQPGTISFKSKIAEGFMQGKAIRKQIEITYEGANGKGVIPLLIFVPTHASKPVPTFLLINNCGTDHTDPDRKQKSEFWPVEQIISSGYAAAVFQVEDVDPDFDDGFINGVHGIMDTFGANRPSNAWGTIAAWAWGACRAMDYFETDPDIDESKVAVAGHSRAGKTALWAGSVDNRFAMVVSNNSGSTGAAISRGKQGETIRDINTTFPHWFNENYKKFNDKEYELPVDQHMLLSMIAPRLLYVCSATEDLWADPESEFLSTVLAGQVYQLFGLHGLGTTQLPAPDSPIVGDHMGYHTRTGTHDLTKFDWTCFLDFADKYLK